jgi:beta-glucosidase
MKQTGRPYAAENKYTSKYLDISNEPLYPFGYGLTYTAFTYSAPTLSSESMSRDDSIMVSVTVSNTGDRAGQEIVQMYVRDLVGSVTRPVKELKAFEKISLEPGEEKKVRFSIDADDLAFYNQALEYGAEPGNFQVMVGPSSSELQILVFSLTE